MSRDWLGKAATGDGADGGGGVLDVGGGVLDAGAADALRTRAGTGGSRDAGTWAGWRGDR